MIEFTDLASFKTWADEYDVSYNIDYQYNDNVAAGKLISSSHKKGDIIKNSDTVKLVISQGGNTKIPSLIGLTKANAESTCKNANIKCSFTGNGDKVIKQSMQANSTVPAGTSITVTLGE